MRTTAAGTESLVHLHQIRWIHCGSFLVSKKAIAKVQNVLKGIPLQLKIIVRSLIHIGEVCNEIGLGDLVIERTVNHIQSRERGVREVVEHLIIWNLIRIQICTDIPFVNESIIHPLRIAIIAPETLDVIAWNCRSNTKSGKFVGHLPMEYPRTPVPRYLVV